MTDERRYGEEEVRAIFEAASQEQEGPERRGALPSDGGLTLSELQAIGTEVGISRERIADAARALEVRGVAGPSRTLLGAPLAVGRSVELPRAPTDREWEMMVAELRQTFRARGKVAVHGGSREWWNGNLHALVEPTEDGHRLRLGTWREQALIMSRMGLGMLGLALIVLVASVLAGGATGEAFFAPLVLGAIGAGLLGSSVLPLPRWARARREQMDHVAGRALALLGSSDSDPSPEGG
ncbi:MAG: hypothetical protein PVI57_19085 [Gemmatimonadota bacterium]